jgi:hypothetical protein
MGDPRFYYYPEGGGLETVDLAEGLSNIEIVMAIRREDAIGLSGAMSTAILGPSWTVRVVLENFGTPGAVALERKLETLINHLRRGGLCGFARDHAKAFCAARAGASARGWAYINTGGNAFSAWSAAAVIASGDEVAIEQAPPGCLAEVRLSSGMTGTRIDLSETTVYEMDPAKGTAWVRHRDFFPVCYLSAEDARTNPLTHDHRRNYTLDLRLSFDSAGLATLLTAGGGTGKDVAGTGPGTGGVYDTSGWGYAVKPALSPSSLGGTTIGVGATLETLATNSNRAASRLRRLS